MVVRFKDLKSIAEKAMDDKEAIRVPLKSPDGEDLGEIEIKQDIPIENIKVTIDDIMMAAFMDGAFNPTLYEVATRLAIITTFTNMIFTAKEKEKPYLIYNTIETLNLYPQIVKAIDADEYKSFMSLLEDTVKYQIKHRSSMEGIVSAFVNGIPKMTEAAINGVEKFTPEQIAAAMNVVNSTNSGNIQNITVVENTPEE